MMDYELEILDLGDHLDPLDDKVDVEVKLPDGSRWSATFFTLANVQSPFRRTA